MIRERISEEIPSGNSIDSKHGNGISRWHGISEKFQSESWGEIIISLSSGFFSEVGLFSTRKSQ
jgi:hypothetical protein